ncbi:MAG: DUF3761 domain-containing protein [Nocardioidaceae bacterium]
MVSLALLVFFPVGLALMWRGRVWSPRTRWAVTVTAVALTGLLGAAVHPPATTPQAASRNSAATHPRVTRSHPATTRWRHSPTRRAAARRRSVPVRRPATHPAHPRGARSVGTGDRLLLAGAVVLPNGVRTPGAINPAVTQANIGTTICRTGYTDTIRPSSSYTTGLKEQQLATGYGYRGQTSTGDYEEDHLISLELGGSASSPSNLWPEPYSAADGARVKDLVENRLHDLVCSRQVSLATARRAIATNWWAAYQRYGGAGVPQVWNGSYGGAAGGSQPGSTRPTASGSGTPSGVTARCGDGTYSHSQHRSGTCSYHGGVAVWINPPAS